MTKSSDGAMATHSPALAEATIYEGAGWVLESCAKSGSGAHKAAKATKGRYLFI